MFRFPFPLRAADDPGSPPSPPPPGTVTPPAAGTVPSPPPAAHTVVTGEITERERQALADRDALKAKLEEEANARKQVEVRAGELEDENHRLRRVQLAPKKKREWGTVLDGD